MTCRAIVTIAGAPHIVSDLLTSRRYAREDAAGLVSRSDPGIRYGAALCLRSRQQHGHGRSRSVDGVLGRVRLGDAGALVIDAKQLIRAALTPIETLELDPGWPPKELRCAQIAAWKAESRANRYADMRWQDDGGRS